MEVGDTVFHVANPTIAGLIVELTSDHFARVRFDIRVRFRGNPSERYNWLCSRSALHPTSAEALANHVPNHNPFGGAGTVTLPPPAYPGQTFTVKVSGVGGVGVDMGTKSEMTKEHCEKNGIAYRDLGQTCDHAMETYNSGWTAYRFCTKCEHKENL